jgi:hypothetical protein
MLNRRHILGATMAILMASASSALAGTKVKANLVPVTTSTTETLSPKSSMLIKDTPALKVQLKDVLAGGVLVNSAAPYDPAVPSSVDPSDYVVIVHLNVVAVPIAADLIVPVSLKKGAGKTAPDVSGLGGLLLPGLCRSLGAIGADVWGPIGDSASDPDYLACKDALTTSLGTVGGITVPPAVWLPGDAFGPNPCALGDNIGTMGLALP